MIQSDVFDRAVAAYARFCERNGYIYQQPSNTSEITSRKVVLENCNGVLAVYKITKTGRLRMVEEEAA